MERWIIEENFAYYKRCVETMVLRHLRSMGMPKDEAEEVLSNAQSYGFDASRADGVHFLESRWDELINEYYTDGDGVPTTAERMWRHAVCMDQDMRSEVEAKTVEPLCTFPKLRAKVDELRKKKLE